MKYTSMNLIHLCHYEVRRRILIKIKTMSMNMQMRMNMVRTMETLQEPMHKMLQDLATM